MPDLSSFDAVALSSKLIALQLQSGIPILIAFDGRSGSGKTTFANALASKLPSTIISGDDFFSGGVEVLEHPAEELAELCIDRRRLRPVLEALKSYRPALFRPFDWSAFDGRLAAQEKRLVPNPFLILEGVYSFHPDVRDLIDYAILMETPDAERLSRLAAREGHLSDWERQWHRAEDWYFDTISPADHFDETIANV